MHILFLSDNFPPEVNAPASRTFEHAREWVVAGHRVTVLTSVPNFPRGKVFDGYRNRLWQTEEVAGIRVIRVWTFISANEGFWLRIIDQLSYMVMAMFAALFVRRVDIIVATSPQFFTAVAGWVVSVLKWRPWVFELRDIWPESIKAVGAMKASRVLGALEKLELFLYRRASAVISVTQAFRANLIARGIDGAKISVVTNGADLSRYVPRAKDTGLIADLGLEGKFTVGYIGTHGMAHGLGTVLDAAALLQGRGDVETQFLFLGDGSEKAGLKERAKSLALNNVLFLDTVSKDEVVRYWSILDAALIHLRATDLFQTVIPSKLFECMAMGLPILFGVRGEAAQIVQENEVGLFFEPENAESLTSVIQALRADRALGAQFAQNGIRAAKKFDRRTLAAQMLATLVDVSGGPKTN